MKYPEARHGYGASIPKGSTPMTQWRAASGMGERLHC